MGPPVDSITTSETAPTRADVVVVGGGIIGTSTAYWLARKGISVTVVEKGVFAGEQSSRNWGWVRRMGRDERELPLIVESMRQWDGIAETTGHDVGFRRSGIMYLCETEQDVAYQEDWIKRAGDHALDSHIVKGAKLEALLPSSMRQFRAALYTPSDGRAEPQMAVPAIASAAKAMGATLLDNCAILDIDMAGGRVAGVNTEKGYIACTSVVVAGGAWSSHLLKGLSIRLPQLGVVSSVMRTGPMDGGPDGAVWGQGFAYRKRMDGGYTIAQGSRSIHEIVADSFRYLIDFLPMLRLEWNAIGLRVGKSLLSSMRDPSPFQSTRVLDPDPYVNILNGAHAKLMSLFPVFRNAPIIQKWAGVIDAMPDAIPVISPVVSHPGLVIATGFSGHGFGIGPGAGRLAANLVTGDGPCVDPRPFRYDRFTDGTRPRPSTGV